MSRIKQNLLLIAFVVSFFAVGISYWFIPYNKVNLPNALLGPSLLVVFLSALILRLYGNVTFWKAVNIVGASMPAAVFARVIVEGVKDLTSHNLWPLEVIIALFVGFFCALIGVVIGGLITNLAAR